MTEAFSQSGRKCSQLRETTMSRRLKKSRTAENYVVIGGGIAGVGCAQELARLASDKNIILISASDTLVEVQPTHYHIEPVI